MNNVSSDLPVLHWGDDVLLAYFTSNTDPNRNFAKFFKETRARLYEMLIERASGGDSTAEESYLNACLEYEEHPSMWDLQYPVRHQTRFTTAFKKNSTEGSDCFVVRSHHQTQRLLKLGAMHIEALRSKH